MQPWYSSNTAHKGEGEPMRQSIEPLLYANKVNAVFAGHVHAYERSVPVYNNTLTPDAPVYIVIGDGGNREGLAPNYVNPAPAWSAFRQASYGHGIIDVVNSTHALWTWHRNQDDESVVTDSTWLVR